MKVSDLLGMEDFKDKKGMAKALAAELIGTMFLVFVGCGACVVMDNVGISLAFGLTVATMAQSIGHVSGCHINPAITVGLFCARKIGAIKSVLYIVFQSLGSIIGAGLLELLTKRIEEVEVTDAEGNSILDASGNHVYQNVSVAQGVTAINYDICNSVGGAFGIEFLITFVLVMVVFGAAADDNNAPSVKGSAPLAIGLSITTCHLLAIKYTGSSMNPARSIGPALIWNKWADQWLYWLAPISGGIAASLFYQMVLAAPEPKPKTEYTAVDQNDKLTANDGV